MKNIIFVTIFLLFLTDTFYADENQYSPIHIESTIDKIIKDKNEIYNITNIYDIFPIGWSSDGKFAYIEYVYKHGRPVLAYRLIVQDLITDQIIWESELLDVYDLGDPYTEEEKEDYEKLKIFLEEYNLDLNSPEFFYKYKIEELNTALKENNIIQSSSILVQEFPSEIENDDIDVIRIITENTDKSETYDNIIYDSYSYFIELSKSNTKKKTIHADHLVDESVIDTQIIGFIRSPFESRIAVILGIYRWNHHAGHNIRFKIIGCDLNYGFK